MSKSLTYSSIRPAVALGLLVLAGALAGCRNLPAPIWQTSTVVSQTADEAEPPAAEIGEPVERSVRPSRPTVRWISADETESAFNDRAEIELEQPVAPRFPRVGHPRRRPLPLLGDAPPEDPLVALLSSRPIDELEGAGPGLNDDSGIFGPSSPGENDWLSDLEGGESPDDWWNNPGWLDDGPPISFRDDACGLLPMLGRDFVSLFTWQNAIVIGAGVGGALAVREHLDGDVRDYTLKHKELWGQGTVVLRQFGEFAWQLPFVGGIYAYSVWAQDEYTHEFSKTLVSAYTITALTTVVIKGLTDTQRPSDAYQNGRWGFPSYHAASTFAIAAVIDEYYGWMAGLPAYTLAGLVGWSRIDQREHDLSDVLFGALLGVVIGKTVAHTHFERYTGCEIIPYYNSTDRALGVMFHKCF